MNEKEWDCELLLRVQEKDSEAFEQIVRRYTAYVLTIIRQIAVPPLYEEDAEELAADTFVTLWKKAGTVRDPFALKAYLAQIARNAAMGRLRRHKPALPLDDEILIAKETHPETVVALHEQTEILSAALEAMEPIRRHCLIRRYYYGESLANIAKHLSLPLSTVKSHVYRGRTQLIDALKEWGYSYEENNKPAGAV